MNPSWIWSDKITNEHVARVGYNHFISNKGEWNNCFSKFSNRVLQSIFISTFYKASGKRKLLAYYFPYDVKLRLLAHSQSFFANQKARNAIVGAENLLNMISPHFILGFQDGEYKNVLQAFKHVNGVLASSFAPNWLILLLCYQSFAQTCPNWKLNTRIPSITDFS